MPQISPENPLPLASNRQKTEWFHSVIWPCFLEVDPSNFVRI